MRFGPALARSIPAHTGTGVNARTGTARSARRLMFVWMIEPARASGQTNWRMASVLQDFVVEPLRLHWDKKALVLQNTVPYGVLSAAWLDGTGLFK